LYHPQVKALVIFASLALALSAADQKSADKPPGVLLHGGGQHGSLRVILTGRNGEPARHVGVMVFWECPEVCPILVSSMLTNGVGEFQLDPISLGKYLVCSNLDVDSSRPCFIDVAAASCIVEITPEYPEVELRMQVPKSGITSPKPHDQERCRLSQQQATRLH